MHPTYQGALLIYFNYFEPLFKKNQGSLRERSVQLMTTLFTNLSQLEEKVKEALKTREKPQKAKLPEDRFTVLTP